MGQCLAGNLWLKMPLLWVPWVLKFSILRFKVYDMSARYQWLVWKALIFQCAMLPSRDVKRARGVNDERQPWKRCSTVALAGRCCAWLSRQKNKSLLLRGGCCIDWGMHQTISSTWLSLKEPTLRMLATKYCFMLLLKVWEKAKQAAAQKHHASSNSFAFEAQIRYNTANSPVWYMSWRQLLKIA